MILKGKTQGSAGTKEIRRLPDSKDIGALNQLQYPRIAFGLGTTNEQNVAFAKFRILMNRSNFNTPLVRRRASGEFGQGRSKLKVAHDADQKWVADSGKAWSGQSMKLGEVARKLALVRYSSLTVVICPVAE
jgi:hypothetical protein